MNPLLLAARHGPLVLAGGLVAGLLFPRVGSHLTPHIPVLVVLLLFLSVLRMDPKALLGSFRDVPRMAGLVLMLQLALPLSVLGVAALGGWQGTPVVLALTLMTAAAPIVGSSNICLMMGVAPGHALRLMVIGTALLPLTVLPVLWLSPHLGGAATVISAALRLLVTVGLTTCVALLVRRYLVPAPSPELVQNLDGASAIALAVFVLALMPSVSRVAADAPGLVGLWLMIALVANLGLQWLGFRIGKRAGRDRAVSLGVSAGNRNIALFLVSLPAEVTAPLLVFIGCYQIPMFLTPLLMRRVYRSA
ncbi:hypothetical protein NNA36_04950 [Shimia sp. CNT1-13L.2]|uniref:hypothetical protein n=1 Tax=Shimia sp. CNT1-13L.2 TaxID=2959663 RepID=UPI0020CC7F50|nr:hypothetical protein [Shimia sp. CNT1-13L.2]